MTANQLVFVVLSVFTLSAGFIVVTNRNLFHAALAMMASFFGVAGMYALLGMGFLAAAQLLVYIGAISILIIFAIMMTRRMMQTRETPYNSQWGWGFFTAIFIFGLLAYVIFTAWGFADQSIIAASEPVINDKLVELGQALVTQENFMLPFELASILLLAALIGAVVIAMPEKNE